MNDVPHRYEVMTGQPVIEGGHILIPDRPGLGVDLDEEAIERYPLQGNTIPVEEDPVTTTSTSPLTGAAPPGSPAKTIRYSWIPQSAIRIYLDIGQAFDISDSRQDSGPQVWPIPVEIKVLDAVSTADQRITAPRIEEGGDNRVALQIGTCYNQGKLMRRHVYSSLL